MMKLAALEEHSRCSSASAAAHALGVPFQAVTVNRREWADAYGINRGRATLVRPDGYMAWRGAPDGPPGPTDFAAPFSGLLGTAATTPAHAE